MCQSRLNSVKRDVICQSKTQGGLLIFNMYLKAKCILTSTFLKQFVASQENEMFLKYYCSIRVNLIFNIRDLPINLTYPCTWYFNEIVINLRTFLNLRNFPNITSSDMYLVMLTECKPSITEQYNMNWDKIWKQISLSI